MWQSNISWKEGLFTEIPFTRFQSIKTNSKWDSPLAIFTRVNPRSGNDWPNLRFEGLQTATSPNIGALDTLFSPNYYIVAIDTRSRTTECIAEITTQDNISGKISFKLEYQIASLEIMLTIDDPLLKLKNKAQEEIQESCSNKSYKHINIMAIKNGIQSIQTGRAIGLEVLDIANIKFVWPDEISKTLENITVNELRDQAQNKSNDLKLNKLKEFGITDPVLFAAVLSKTDADFNVLMDHVRDLSQAYQNQAARDQALLAWLAEKDYLARSDLQNLIGPLTDRINEQNSTTGAITKALSSSSENNNRRLTSSAEETNESGSNESGPQIIGTRKINLDNEE